MNRSLRISRCWRAACGVAALASPLLAWAYPPAPPHTFVGLVRDEYGNPLNATGARVVMETDSGLRITAAVTPNLDPGANYSLAVDMDAGITADLYKPTALRPLVPFKMKVIVGTTTYLPIEMTGNYGKLGQSGQRTRLDLTLGVDSNNDGIPDAWEYALIANSGGKLKTLADVKPGDDFDGDGLSNLQEYLAGTYAWDPNDGFTVQMVNADATNTWLQFLAIRGRTYSILGSSDLGVWYPVDFQVVSPVAGAAPVGDFYAADVSTLKVKVVSPAEQADLRYFKLLVR